MDITLELDTRYHYRQKEKGGHQEKKPPISVSDSSKPPQSSSSKKPYHRKNKKGNRIKEGLCNYCGGKHPFGKCFKRPESRKGSSRGFPGNQGKA
ncbi:hypothetical protein O181_060747 [Austropuccinia psidii MF-1]|uniref:Uncharacterized protein n=1 Tax=Austropuccinia psidii MF-1 TaxID=1389203 RepID=A0A9Q3EJA0_9BASI|nr:hypothetical protein [Austropuccinia psidii MF-1]